MENENPEEEENNLGKRNDSDSQTIFVVSRMKGGKRWKQGADACIFKPSVACEDDPVRYPPAIPNMISRIIEVGAEDLDVELILKTNYPELVERGFVVAHTAYCTPKYEATNLNWDASIPVDKRQYGSCERVIKGMRINETINLITPEYSKTYYDFISNQLLAHIPYHIKLNPVTYLRAKKDLIIEAFTRLQGAVTAAIELVPDHGYWVIHADLHSANVLVKSSVPGKPGFSGIADWGRSIYFNIDDDKSILRGLKRYLTMISSVSLASNKPRFKRFQDYIDFLKPDVVANTFPQLSASVFRRVDDLRNELRKPANARNPDIVAAGIAGLRGWMVYSLVKVTYYTFTLDYPDLSSFLNARNQKELIAAVNAFFPNINGLPFYVRPPGAGAGPAAAGAGPAAAGAGAAAAPSAPRPRAANVGPPAGFPNENINTNLQKALNDSEVQRELDIFLQEISNARAAGAGAGPAAAGAGAGRPNTPRYGGKRKTRKQKRKQSRKKRI